MTEERFDAIVIGAGVGGLAAAGLLARAGRRVLVLERHSVVGGCCSTFRRGHFVFDAAVHAIGGCARGDVIGDWLRLLEAEDEVRFARLDPFYSVAAGGERVAVPAELDRLPAALAGIAGEDAARLPAFVEAVRCLGAAFLDDRPDPLRVLAALEELGRRSWAELLAERFRSRRLADVLSALCLYAGLEPARVSAGFMASVLLSYDRGAFYPIGSTQRFADALAAAVRRWGGEVRRRTEVYRIDVDDRGVTGVRFTTRRRPDPGRASAPVVISNGDAAKTLFDWIGREHLPAAFCRRVGRLERSTSALCLYLAVGADGWEVPGHETFFLPPSGAVSQGSLQYTPGGGGEPLTSVCVPTATDATLAPTGHHVVAVTVAADPASVEALRDERGKEFIERALVERAERLVPGVTARVLHRELATPRTIERYTNNGGGSIYGWAKDAERWPVHIGPGTPVPGVYLAGHWAHGGHGVYGAFRSGVLTARAVLEGPRTPDHLAARSRTN